MEYGPGRDTGIPFSQEEKEELYRQKATTAMVLSIIGVAVFFISGPGRIPPASKAVG